MKIPRYYRLPDGIVLTYLGAFLYKIKLVDYFLCGNKLLEPPYFTFAIWASNIRQAFCRHEYEALYRCPKEGEFLAPTLCGMVKSEQSICKKCDKFTRDKEVEGR